MLICRKEETMAIIKDIIARQILDSRGNPTVEVDIFSENGLMGRSNVPSGASTGQKEALELRDNNPKEYLGKSVKKAVENVNKIIAPKIKGMNSDEQKNIDQLMIDLDGTENKSKLGANSLLAVSMAAARLSALEKKIPLYQYLLEYLKVPNKSGSYLLPAPLMNIINGGEHASNNLDIQEFMIVPHLPQNFQENLRAAVEVFHHLKKVLDGKGYSTNVGDEGGFAPNLKSHDEAIDCILEAITKAGYKPGTEFSISLDAAASEFYDGKLYQMQGNKLSSDELIGYYEELTKKYPIYSIEDGLDENDFSGWEKLTSKLGDQTVLVGDDLFVTNKKIFQKGIEQGQGNAILIKVNQIGTLSETLDTITLAYEKNYKAIISHRSGETGDAFIADLAVSVASGHIKTGSASRSDRIEKYNQLLRIAEYLGDKAKYYHIH